MNKVVITQGVSGSGKSTFIKNHFPEAVVCSADHYFMAGNRYIYDRSKIGEAHNSCLRAFVGAILGKAPLVVVDNTNTQRWEMTPYVALAKAYGYEVEIHTFVVKPAVAFKRNSHNVPWDAILRMSMNMETPLSSWGRHFTHLPSGDGWSSHLDDHPPARSLSK